MNDEQAAERIERMQQDWGQVFFYGGAVAMMPIEEWLAAIEQAEAAGPFLDPTLYRDYLYSGKGEIIKDVLRAALVFKKAILDSQAKALSDPRLAV